MARCLGRDGEEVDAFRWTPDDDQDDDPVWLRDAIRNGTIGVRGDGTPAVSVLIRTPLGGKRMRPGDWVIRSPSRGIFSVSNDLFLQAYISAANHVD